MQRKLGQSPARFQRRVGMDATNALHSVTYEIEIETGDALLRPLQKPTKACRKDYVIGAMTDVGEDRSKGPAQIPDMFVYIVERRDDGGIRAKAHQTGCINLLGRRPRRPCGRPRTTRITRLFARSTDDPGLTFIYAEASTRSRKTAISMSATPSTAGRRR